MNRTTALIPLLLLGLWSGATQGQPAPPPPSGPSPLLYVRLMGPQGSRFTVFQGSPAGVTLDSPAPLALRPGYVYRLKLGDLPGRPDVALYPTLEVRGTLCLPPIMSAAQHPAPVVFSDSDIERVLAGAFITKVVVLEHPEKAAPIATTADQPLEFEVRAHEDILAHARVLGRPVLVIRLGGRTLPPEDMTGSVPNTILLPGSRTLGPPPVPPPCEWASHALFDPKLGPRLPEEECLHDGGDAGRPAGQDHTGKLLGLDPADTVAQYITGAGQRQLAISNRVCVCVPRFTVLRTQLLPTGYDTARGIGAEASVYAHARLGSRLPPHAADQREHLVMTAGRERASLVRQTVKAVLVDQVWGVLTVVGVREAYEVVGTLEERPEAPPCPLELCKWVDKHAAQVGDVVTFYLKYTNPGGQPISNVVLSDSLTARLEYIPGTARSDRQASFTTEANEAGSLVLRWEVGGKLLPGQSGMVSFQARIR